MNRPLWNVLIFPGGMENGIEIYQSLKCCKEVNLFSASSNVENQAFYLYKQNHIVRDVREAGWLDDLNKVIVDCKIDVVYPAHSFIIDALHREKKNIKAPVLLPEDDVLDITRSKKKTLALLNGVLPVPQIYQSADEVCDYPVFVKPDNGYGAQGAKVIETASDLQKVDFSRFVVQELLPGREYTVDCFSDNDGNLLFCSGRERSRIRMATSMHAESVKPEQDALFTDYANSILSRIKISGAWFFQMKEDKHGNLRLLEIDVRIAGTMCFNRCRGVNFPLLSLYQFFNLPVSININQTGLKLDRCLRNRYLSDYEYHKVYVDLDDTLVVKGKLNTDLIKFLYQCVNNKIQLILLSKHLSEDKEGYLKRWRLSELFDEKIWLLEDDCKADYIDNEKAIYIDDSFSQRLEVSRKCNIPTYDCSMIECLFDERI